MTFTARLSLLCLLAGVSLLVLGTRKARNRRRRDVLGEPSPACRRGTPEAPC